MAQDFKQRPRRDDDDSTVTELGQVQGRVTDEHFDSLLDEIDTLLEANAEEFVRSFVQKGGQ